MGTFELRVRVRVKIYLYLYRDFSSLPQGSMKRLFPNEKYSKIMQNSQNFHSCPLILIPKWSICRLRYSKNGT